MNSAYPQTPLRRQFLLPEDDTAMLDSLGFPWETISDGQNWLLLHDFPLPVAGYTSGRTSLAIAIPASYPQAPLDMVYFFPPLQRADNRLISTIAIQVIDGIQWQRWSRHYPWRAGIDDLETHLGRIEQWLEEELKR